jgi:antitoxin component of MazEF toxin-antitoxin module
LDILGYPWIVKVLKIRRIGNSNMVAIPRELEDAGYAPGTAVLIERLPDGTLRLLPARSIRERVRETGRQVVAENREALEILAEHDRNPSAQ